MSKPNLILTGPSGFLGEALLRHLEDEFNVYGVRRQSGTVPHSEDRTISWTGSIESLSHRVSDIEPEYIVHLAAHYSPRAHLHELHGMVDASVSLTLGLMEGIQHGSCHVITIGSRFQRLRKGKAINTYAALKNCQEELISLYQSKEVTVSYLEMGDLYGPCDRRDKLIQQMIESSVSLQPFKLRYPNNLLFPVYIDDATRAILAALKCRGRGDQRFSVVGPQGGVTVARVASLIPNLIVDVAPLSGDASQDEDRGHLETLLDKSIHPYPPVDGWYPEWDLATGLRATQGEVGQ